MTSPDRPLSPHLSVYRWPITMALSIFHRATGIGLATGLLVLMAWLMSIASGPESYLSFTTFMTSIVGRVLLVAWSFAFFYHMLNGVRHLFWDGGYGFEKKTANASAWVVIALTLVLTAAYWLVLL